MASFTSITIDETDAGGNAATDQWNYLGPLNLFPSASSFVTSRCRLHGTVYPAANNAEGFFRLLLCSRSSPAQLNMPVTSFTGTQKTAHLIQSPQVNPGGGGTVTLVADIFATLDGNGGGGHPIRRTFDLNLPSTTVSTTGTAADFTAGTLDAWVYWTTNAMTWSFTAMVEYQS